MKNAMAVANINFRTSRLAYLIFAVVVATVFINLPINILVEGTENHQPSPGSYAYLLVVLFAVFVPALHFRKFMNLNVKKATYIKGCAINYGILAFVASAFNTLMYLAVDGLLTIPPRVQVWNLLDVFGWSQNILIVAFFQQFAFLLLLAATAHLLTTIQTFWYGWVVDVVVVAIIAVFTPIPVLREVLIAFFGLILLNSNALVHIPVCLALAAAFYLLSIIPVKHKPV